jgi:hypothetical protein
VIQLRVDRDTATPHLQRLIAQAQRPRGIVAAALRAMRNYLVKHFRALDRSNPTGMPGAKRQHFWLDVARSVQNPEIGDHSGSVTVSDPRTGYRLFGGTITAKRTQFLTIPVTGEAYGRTARVFEAETGNKLFPMGGVLAYRSDKGAMPVVAYLLRRSVTKPAEPDKQPNLDAMSADALNHAQAAFDREIQRRN